MLLKKLRGAPSWCALIRITFHAPVTIVWTTDPCSRKLTGYSVTAVEFCHFLLLTTVICLPGTEFGGVDENIDTENLALFSMTRLLHVVLYNVPFNTFFPQ